MSGITGQDDGDTPEDTNNIFESIVGDYFDKLSKTFKSTAGAVFGGDFSKLNKEVDDKASWIIDFFSNGQLLVASDLGEATDALWKNVQKVIVSSPYIYLRLSVVEIQLTVWPKGPRTCCCGHEIRQLLRCSLSKNRALSFISPV